MAEGRSVSTAAQPAYNAGEISPLLFGRIDLDKYKSGLALARNVYVDYRGGLSNRAGTQYMGTILGPAQPKGIPFVVDTDTSYSVIFTGDGNIQFYSNGAYVTGADLASPYAVEDIPDIKWNQSADVMTLTHPAYPVYNLTRTGPTTFSLVQAIQGPQMQPPTNPVGHAQSAGNNANVYTFQITSVSVDGQEESIPCTPFFFTGNGAATSSSTINSLSWEVPASGPTVGYYKIYKAGPYADRDVENATPGVAPTVYGYIGQSSSTSFLDTDFTPDYSHTPPQFQDPFSPGQIASIQPSAITGWSGYDAARLAPLVFTGGDPTTPATGYSIIDTNTNQPVGCVIVFPGTGYQSLPVVTDSIGDATYDVTLGQLSGTYPATSTYFQQRLTYGGTDNFPQSIVLSIPGKYNNFDTSVISNASDSIVASLASTQTNTIVSMVPMSTGLIVFTTGSAFLVTGGGASTAITPSSLVALPQSSFGASDLPPIPINYTVLYTEKLGFTVRDLTFNFYYQNYVGVDRSILSSHLFFDYTFVDWGFAEAPFRLLHATRSDGQLIIMTYVPEQEMFAWTHYDTNGQFVSCWTVPEGETNAVYVIVKRYIQGSTSWKYYLERFVFRHFRYPIDLGMWFVDSGLAYPQNAPSNTLQLGPLVANLGTFTYDGSAISATAGDIIQAYGCQFEVLSSGSGTISVQLLFGTPPTIPNDPFDTVIPFTSGNWTITTPVTVVTGLDYLEGMYVTGMADGVVIPLTLVKSGSITLQAPATSILIGLPYTSQIQTLRLTEQGTTVEGKRKNIPAVTLRQYQTAGLQIGKTFNTLVTQKGFTGPLNPQVQLLDGDIRSIINATWNKDGQFCIQQSLPLPMTILADFPEVVSGDTYRS